LASLLYKRRFSANADRFVITIIGVADSNEVFLLEQYAARIPFAEQLLKIEEYYLRFKPEIIGIESNAYQAALVQQTERLTSMPPVVPMFAKGKKWERILAMSPLFRIGKVKIKKIMLILFRSGLIMILLFRSLRMTVWIVWRLL
jgi:hypothetical protein